MNFPKHLNSTSAGHFYKKLFQRKIVDADGGNWSMSCLIMGHCSRHKLEMTYDSQNRPVTLVASSAYNENDEFKVEDSCEFSYSY